ncbi:hypothetical protein EI94DRAFT_1579359 [Lactarius quietus]|nr:hypothetical protein EI94DRAFT_1579359 [Lactarius quietus]
MSVTLKDGTSFPLISTYTVQQSHAVIALVVASCISLTAAVGLLFAIAMSAFNTRMVKNPNMFVRTHVVYYFVSLLLCDILQAIGSIMNSAWINNQAVLYVSLCTAQGVIKQMADVGIALWTLVIATRTFLVLFLRVPHRRYTKWITLIANWSLFGAIVTAGPAIATVEHGPFYGISGDWCWISSNYGSLRITLDYMVIFISALLAFIMYLLVFWKSRGIVRAQTTSTTVASAAQDRNEKYEHKLARQMLLYPIAYTLLILPIASCRFSEWTGHDVPFAVTIFSDFIYLLSGLVHVILFASTRRLLPPSSMFPKFLISNPRALTSTTLPEDDLDSYYTDATSVDPWYPPSPGAKGGTKARDPFSDSEQHPNGDVIRRVHSPDPSRSSSRAERRDSERTSLSLVEEDYGEMRDVSLSLGTPQWRFQVGEAEEYDLEDDLELVEQVSPAPTHREGEKMQLPETPPSAHRHY